METIENIADLPEMGEKDIHIWGVHIPDMLDQLDRLHGLLNKEEQEKAARFHREKDRNSSIAARGALRVLLGGYSKMSAEEIEFEYSENGKPHFVPQASRLHAQKQGRRDACDTEQGRRDACGTGEQGRLEAGGTEQGRQDACDTLSFNVSHSGDWVVIALGRGRNIGVDVEKIRRDLEVMAIVSRYFTPEEAELITEADDRHALFFHFWARKEAYVKAAGSALFRELSTFAVPVDDGEKDGWHFRRLEAGSKYAAAVVTDRPVVDVTCYDFGSLKFIPE